MVPKRPPRASKSWAYAYQLDPPQPEPRLAKVKTLLRRARLADRADTHRPSSWRPAAVAWEP